MRVRSALPRSLFSRDEGGSHGSGSRHRPHKSLQLLGSVGERCQNVFSVCSLALLTRSLTGRAFSSLDEVRGNGSLLVNASPDDEIIDKYVVFPSMQFNCSGNITKLRFLAFPDPDKNPYVSFGLGYHHRATYWSGSDVNHIGGSGTGFELSYQPGEMIYHAGYIFAVNQSYTNHKLLFYDMGEKRRRCISDIVNWQNGVTSFGHQPLVSIETGNTSTHAYTKEGD